MSVNRPEVDQAYLKNVAVPLLMLTLTALIASCIYAGDASSTAEDSMRLSDHFDGERFFNPPAGASTSAGAVEQTRRGRPRWIWRLLFGNDWPEWPPVVGSGPGPAPAVRISGSSLVITPVGHATFLIQLNGLNILTDPIWSQRCSPVSWAGPKRFQDPGIRFEDLPPIDAVLVSHNHYDHLDLPTLKRLAKTGAKRAITSLGNRDLILGSGIAAVDELDWWDAVRLSEDVSVTLVPAQHFSSRTLWDRNKSLWGGFVISGASGTIYFSGDTGYGPHFQEIARRFSPIRAAVLPISPFRPRHSSPSGVRNRSTMHMGPAEAVQAHLDLQTDFSMAAHFQVFQLGADGFDDALSELGSVLAERAVTADDFIAPRPGQAINLPVGKDRGESMAILRNGGPNQ